MNTTLAADRAEILRTAHLLMGPGEVYELRALKVPRHRTVSGYFDSPEQLANAALEADRMGAPAIYVTMNPVNPALRARANGRLQSYAELTTSDGDIVRRKWLLIDCDPKRPSGISSTDDEHERAISTACGIWDDLRGQFGDPVVCDSGNGAHLLYPIDLPNTPESTELIKRLLVNVAKYSAPDDIDVDLTVFNAARITKLYGTVTRKGDSTPDRPHRLSRILEIPRYLERAA